jgi:hypothetical protein
VRGLDVDPVAKESQIAQTLDWACLALIGAYTGFNEIWWAAVRPAGSWRMSGRAAERLEPLEHLKGFSEALLVALTELLRCVRDRFRYIRPGGRRICSGRRGALRSGE